MVTASVRWLNNVSGVYLIQVSWLLIGQRSLQVAALAEGIKIVLNMFI